MQKSAAQNKKGVENRTPGDFFSVWGEFLRELLACAAAYFLSSDSVQPDHPTMPTTMTMLTGPGLLVP